MTVLHSIPCMVGLLFCIQFGVAQMTTNTTENEHIITTETAFTTQMSTYYEYETSETTRAMLSTTTPGNTANTTTKVSTTQAVTTQSTTMNDSQKPTDTTITIQRTTNQAGTTMLNTTSSHTKQVKTTETITNAETDTQPNNPTTSQETTKVLTTKIITTEKSTIPPGTTNNSKFGTTGKTSTRRRTNEQPIETTIGTTQKPWYKETWAYITFAVAAVVLLVILVACVICICPTCRQKYLSNKLTMIGAGERLQRWSHRLTKTFDNPNVDVDDSDVEDPPHKGIAMTSFKGVKNGEVDQVHVGDNKGEIVDINVANGGEVKKVDNKTNNVNSSVVSEKETDTKLTTKDNKDSIVDSNNKQETGKIPTGDKDEFTANCTEVNEKETNQVSTVDKKESIVNGTDVKEKETDQVTKGDKEETSFNGTDVNKEVTDQVTKGEKEETTVNATDGTTDKVITVEKEDSTVQVSDADVVKTDKVSDGDRTNAKDNSRANEEEGNDKPLEHSLNADTTEDDIKPDDLSIKNSNEDEKGEYVQETNEDLLPKEGGVVESKEKMDADEKNDTNIVNKTQSNCEL